MSTSRWFHAATVVSAAVLPPALAGAAPVPPAAPGRMPQQRDQVAVLQKRVLALAGVEAVTVETLASALGVRLGPPVQVHQYRREWPVLPSELLAAGEIIEAGRDIILSVKPARALEVSFEDLADVLSKLPYYLETRASHIEAHSVATRVYAVDHVFRVNGGALHIQIPTTLAPATPNHDVQAQRQGYDGTFGVKSRQTRVESILFTTRRDRPWPDGMTESLADKRKRKARARRR